MEDKLMKIARSLSNAELKKLNDMHKNKGKLDNLLAQKKSLEKKLAAVNDKLAKIAGGAVSRGAPAKKGGGRRGGKSLADYAFEALAASGKPMKISEIADAVLKAGYKTTSKKISPMLTNALSKRSDVKKVSRGLYQAGSAKKSAPKEKAPAKKSAAKKPAAKKAAPKKQAAKKTAPKKGAARKRTPKASAPQKSEAPSA